MSEPKTAEAIKRVRVRFAPSPTGHLHIGGARTALFNWFYAKNQGGQFFLRIEDTDRQRSEIRFEQEILASLKWLGMDWEPLVMRQSENLPVYQRAAALLVEKGLAHAAEEGSKAIVFRVDPAAHIVFHDLVHGEIQFRGQDIGDFVILKSDGFPTYHFACVVDDSELGMTHVIRGDDHLSNTPKQILLYQALDLKAPKFAHIPLILGQDGTPLSKRHGAVSLEAFRREGFLAQGLINYLSLLGWGVAGGQEFFSVEEIIQKFSLKRINKTGAAFDMAKLKAINARHLKQLPPDQYWERLETFLKEEGQSTTMLSHPRIKEIALLYQDRIKTFAEFLDHAGFFFLDDVQYETEALSRYLSREESRRLLRLCMATFDALPLHRSQEWDDAVRAVAAQERVAAAEVIHPLRVCVTGKSVSPSLFDVLLLLGKTAVLKRIDSFLSRYPAVPMAPTTGDLA